MRKFDPDKKLVPTFVYEEKRLPIHLPVGQYIRQSSEGQLKNNKQSSILQDKKLSERLTAMGFTTIIKIEQDTGSSGQVIKSGKYLERKGLDYLHQLITSGTIGAVAAFSPSRLYRDLTRKFYAEFVYLLETNNIPLITYQKIYWPDSRADMDMLMQEFAVAANFIKDEVYGKLVLAKNQAVEDNCSYGGGSVPFGFVVRETPDRKYFVVYQPHAEKIIFIFKRYRELGGNLPRLGRELQATGFSFPEFDMELLRTLGAERKPYVTLRYKNGGYPCYTREALLSILTNPAYLGWYCYAGAIISKESHEPIVDRSDFDFAFSRLSPVNLDGTPNVNKPKAERRYNQYHGLVETLLTCNGNPCYAMYNSYMVREQIGKWKSATMSVAIETIDTAVSCVIPGVLYALDKRHKQGLSDDLYQQIEVLAQEKQAEGVSLDKALKNIESAIRGWELDKESCRATGNIIGLNEANRQLKDLYAAREQVVAKAKQAAQEQTTLQTTMSLHQQIIKTWWELPFANQQRYVSLILQSVTMEEVGPHILKLVATFKSPIVATLTGYVLREHCGQHTWTDAENEAIRWLYPAADRVDILKAIPERTWKAIRQQAMEMGVNRSTWANTSGIPNNLSYADSQLIEQLQTGYPGFGKAEETASETRICFVRWEPFDTAVLSISSNKQGLPHHQPVEY